VTKLGFKSMINRRITARTRNPDDLGSFFRQRLNWGRGFRQLTERHPETFTRKIKLCFLWMSAMLVSPLLTLVNIRLAWVFPILAVYNMMRFVPGTIAIYKKTKDVGCCSTIPFLRFINALAYLLGWSHWCLLESIGRRSRLDPFISSSSVPSPAPSDLPV
jgi:cellulose synthase/poly-beta-1,6-N-acetylglucosamine synthase-like glycosyltransferase